MPEENLFSSVLNLVTCRKIGANFMGCPPYVCIWNGILAEGESQIHMGRKCNFGVQKLI
jgi:hypothetical protein